MKFKALRHAARDSLAAASINPKKLALLYAGVAVLVSLVLTLADYLLGNAIADTGGIMAMGNRATLRTVQAGFMIAGAVALPLWNLGFIAAALGISRRERVTSGTMLEGFRRFWPILRMYILQLLIGLLVGITCWQVGGILFAFSPFSNRFLRLVLEVLGVTDPNQMMNLTDQQIITLMENMTEAQSLSIAKSLIPMFVIIGLLLLVLGLPLYYRFRMMSFAIMGDVPRARKALLHVTRILRGRKHRLFLLDLYFWWYHGARLLLLPVAFGGMLLDALGIQLPISLDAQVFLFYGIYLALEFALSFFFAPLVQTTYAHFYEDLQKNPPQPKYVFAAPPMPPQQETTDNS